MLMPSLVLIRLMLNHTTRRLTACSRMFSGVAKPHRKAPNKSAAPNPAMALPMDGGRYWRGSVSRVVGHTHEDAL